MVYTRITIIGSVVYILLHTCTKVPYDATAVPGLGPSTGYRVLALFLKFLKSLFFRLVTISVVIIFVLHLHELHSM